MLRPEAHDAVSVSVVIPTRNRPELVSRAVRSALRQTETGIEIIVVIDGEDPCTAEALRALGDPRIRILALPASVGGSEARNVGVRAAKAKWIALLDDDDEWLPTKIARQLAIAESLPGDHFLISCRYYYRTENCSDIVRPKQLPRPGEDPSEYQFNIGCGFQTSGYFCRRSLALKTPFNPELRVEQDTDWVLRLRAHDDFTLVPVKDPLYIYYAPENRPTISRQGSWETRLEYARTHRTYFSPRAYSRFLVRSCIRRAVAQKAGWGKIATLAREFFLSGHPEVKTTVAFVAALARLGARG